ncbi:MAG TPA: pantoate--beta-alanine ligase [Armatimonadota bacterium]|nr:pantoate--beta-alanine ligase [Armatimonadota bacterium]
MEILHTIKETRAAIAQTRREGESVGLVPTMGCFHEGHLSLMRRARQESDLVVVSIFVNPIQFGPGEDFREYPRDLERDARMAREVGVDLIFNPSVEEIYPEGYRTYVEVAKLSEVLCGASRPGHFRGVTTVVLKLLSIVQPDKAYFGRKDYQQLKIIERMVKDLDLPIRIVEVPTVREPDGLAMSSRNTYLSPEERRAALVSSKSLAYAQELLDQGITSGEELRQRVEKFILQEPLARIDYVAVVHPETLEHVVKVEGEAVLALAVRIGGTRLIDNTLLAR